MAAFRRREGGAGHPGREEPPGSFDLRTFSRGAAAAWPICLGYFPIGLAFGVAAQKTGLTPLEIGLMSCIVFAGSAQFVGVSMLGMGAGIPAIILTAFTVNLRHLLMSSALALHLKLKDPRWIALFGYGVTDESFAVNLVRFRSGVWDWREALVVNHTANIAWVASTTVGGYAGVLIPPGAFGIDYALPAMLLSLLAFQLHDRIHVMVGVLSGIIAVILCLILPGNLYMLIAPVIAATAGLFAVRGRNRGKKGRDLSS